LGSGRAGPLRLAGLLSEFFTAAIFPAFWASWESSEVAAGALSAPVFTLTFAPPAFQIYVSVPHGRRRRRGTTTGFRAVAGEDAAWAAFLARIVRDILPPAGTNDGEERPPPGAFPRPVEGPS
jgi:hypothetical protein